MSPIPKFLVITGVILILDGLLWPLLGRFLHLRRLPGDIVVEKENFKFYFPIVTCIMISVVLSLVMYVIHWFSK